MKAFDNVVMQKVKALMHVLNRENVKTRWSHGQQYEDIMTSIVTLALSDTPLYGSGKASAVAPYRWESGQSFGRFLKNASQSQKKMIDTMLNVDYIWDVQMNTSPIRENDWKDWDTPLGIVLNLKIVRVTPLMLSLMSKRTALIEQILEHTTNPSALSTYSESKVLAKLFPKISLHGAPISALTLSAYNVLEALKSYDNDGERELLKKIMDKVQTITSKEYVYVSGVLDGLSERQKGWEGCIQKLQSLAEHHQLDRSIKSTKEVPLVAKSIRRI